MRALERLLVAILLLALPACSTIRPVSTGAMKAYELSLAVSPDQLAVAWYGGLDDTDSIFLQWLDPAGRAAGEPLQITNGESRAFEPDLQLVDGDPLLAWYEKNVESGALTAWLARTDHDGKVIWKQALGAGDGNARNPVVRVSATAIHVAWIETPLASAASPAVWTERFALDGKPANAPRRAGEASKDTWNLNAVMDRDGVFYIVYDAKLGAQESELRLLAVNDQSVKAIPLSADDGHASLYPDLAISEDGQAALTWFDARDGNDEIYLGVLPLTDLLAGKTPPAQRLTHTQAESIGAYLAWNGARLAVVWCDASEGQLELYAQMFDSTGRAQARLQRITTSPAQSSIPAIRPYRDSFLIAWNEYDSIGPHGAVLHSEAMTARLPH